MFWTFGNKKIFYTVKQSKNSQTDKLFVLVHGMGTDHNYHLLKYLAGFLLNYGAVVAFDLSGYGKSSGGVKARNVEIFVADLTKVINRLKKDRRFSKRKIIIVGHSLGALVTLINAAIFKSRIAGAAVIASNAESNRLYKQYCDRGDIQEYASYSLFKRHKLAADFWQSRARLQPLKLARQIKCPVLFIYGRNDRTNPPSEGQKLLRAVKSPKKLVIIPGANHHFTKTKEQQAVWSSIKQWLKIYEK